jgi:hypothetical protein
LQCWLATLKSYQASGAEAVGRKEVPEYACVSLGTVGILCIDTLWVEIETKHLELWGVLLVTAFALNSAAVGRLWSTTPELVD